MIDPLARGVDPVQLAFQSLVTMGVRTQPARTESPLAVVLQQLGVDLAHAQPFTTIEAKQFVSLVRATVEVLVETAVLTDQPAHHYGPVLETAQVAMRDLQRAVTQVLTEHLHLTTSLAPILRQLLVAMQEPANVLPGLHTAVPARFFPESFSARAEFPRAVASDRAAATEVPPTLARLVSSLVESMVRLQAVLPPDAVPRAEALALPEHPSAPGGAEHVLAAAPLPIATTRLLQTLVEAIADLLTLLPMATIPAPAGHVSDPRPTETLVRTLSEAVALLHEVLPVTAGRVNERSALIEHSPPGHDATRVPQATPLPTVARLANSVAQVISLVHELLASARPSTEAPAARPSASVADSPPRLRPSPPDLSPRLAPSLAEVPPRLAPGLADVPPRVAPGLSDVPQVLAAGPIELPPLLAASLAEIITHLKAGLPPAVLETMLDESAPLLTGTVLAQLQAAAANNTAPAGGIGAPVNPLEMFDAYRWGLVVALNYRSAVGRPSRARLSVARPRCQMCDRLLEQTRSGALVCPTC